MNVSVNRKFKKYISKKIILENKTLRFFKKTQFTILIISIICSLLYLIFNLISAKANIINIGGVPTKDIFSIVSNSISILILGFFVTIVFKVILYKLSNKNINEREDESLVVFDDRLIYAFRTKDISLVTSKIVFVISYNDLTSIKYNEKINKFDFFGSFVCKYVYNFGLANEEVNNEVIFKEFSIYDYFSPSLYEQLCSKDIGIEKG